MKALQSSFIGTIFLGLSSSIAILIAVWQFLSNDNSSYTSVFDDLHPLIEVIVNTIVLGFNFYLCQQLAKRLKLIKGNFVFSLVYMAVFVSLAPQVLLNTSFLLFLSLLSLLFILFFKIQKQSSIRLNLFGQGILMGIASLFYLPSLAYLLTVYFALAILRPFQLRDYLILGIGSLLPGLYYFSSLFLLKGIPFSKDLISQTSLEFSFGLPMSSDLILLLYGLFAAVGFFMIRSSLVVHLRNQLVLVLGVLIISLISVVCFQEPSYFGGLMLALIFLLTPLLEKMKRPWLAESLIILHLIYLSWINLG